MGVDDQPDGAGARASVPSVDAFLGEPTRDLDAWAGLWTHDVAFPIQGSGGVKGRFGRLVKRLLRPFVKAPMGDLLDRQRAYNLIVLEHLVGLRHEMHGHVRAHQERLDALDDRTTQAFQELQRHNDALFSRVDQKLDRYRREAKDLWHRLGALLAEPVEEGGSPRLAEGAGESFQEQGYLALEERYRGAEDDIAERVSVYRPYLEGHGDVVDLGCGRGEALEVFARDGLTVRGVDSSGEMVARCREKGLDAVEADLFDFIAGLDPESVGAIVSFHVIEHLPAPAVDRLVRLAWRALRPGGVLILETPSPLALAMSARDFWMDPTHQRPVHPAHLEVTYREAGFEPVHRVDLRPFPDDQRLPELDLAALPDEQHALADQVNRLRDLLDELLFGARDFGLVGHKPG